MNNARSPPSSRLFSKDIFSGLIIRLGVFIWYFINLVLPLEGLEEVFWWPTENMTQDSEERCRINIGPVAVWSSPFEPLVAAIHYVDSLRLLYLVGLHSRRCEFIGWSWLNWLMVNAVSHTQVLNDIYSPPTASLQRGKIPPWASWYDIKPSDAPTLELCGIWSTPLLPLLSGPLWLRVVSCDRVLSMGQIELSNI